MSTVEAKELGAYYTPEVMADSLAEWAVREGDERILEPSAGEGALVAAIHARASGLSSHRNPRILAFDISRKSIRKLRGYRTPGLRVLHRDFLEVDPEDFPPFDVVVANPPFTRNHELDPKRKKELRKRLAIFGAAGLWVYFIIHSMRFLKKGGRLISIVPNSIFFTDYGEALLKRVSQQFSRVRLDAVPRRPRWSHEALEKGAIITAEGFKTGAAKRVSRGVWQQDESQSPRPRTSSTGVFNRILRSSRQLGEISSVSIGVVTGRNRVFLLSEAERQEAGIPPIDVHPIVSRVRHLSGTSIDKNELAMLGRYGEKTWLLTPRSYSGASAQHLDQVAKTERDDVAWFKKRSPWWRVQLGEYPDAIFTYMNDRGPRICLAGKEVLCTNTLHRIVFDKSMSRPKMRSVILSSLSTFGELAAENLGRGYGGGLLKFEVKDARRYPVLLLEAFQDQALFRRIDTAMRSGASNAAQDLVDSVMMESIFCSNVEKHLEVLRAELDQCRITRRA